MPASTKNRSADSLTHSVRCSAKSWDKAKERAEREGWTMNRAVVEFIEGYGDHKIDLPEIVRVYPTAVGL